MLCQGTSADRDTVWSNFYEKFKTSNTINLLKYII
jgi:hypothetical protein